MSKSHEAVPAVSNRFLSGNFLPVAVETTSVELVVDGHIPEELAGRFVRIGPNPIRSADPERFHWFTGTGMVHGLRLGGGRALWYRNRFVKSAEAAAALGRKPLPGPGAGSRDGTVNTHLTSAGGRLFALVEAGDLPVELDSELESVTRSDFGGTLEAGFTAHPKFDPVTGLQHAITYEIGEPVRYVTLDRSGRAATLARIDLPHLPMIHDTAFTASSIVVLDLPVTFQPQRAQTDFPWLWDEQAQPRIGLLPRAGDLTTLRWFEAPRCFVFHILNAYDDGDRTVVDLVRHPRMFAAVQSAPGEGLPLLARWTLHQSSGCLEETVLDDHGCEFPRLNGAFGGRHYRFGYTALSGQTGFGPALKHDVERQTTELHDYGPGRMTMEPVFVARVDAEREDDGWVISFVYDRERNLSDVVILEARDFAGDPVAIVHLPVRVPFGFHGGWAPDDFAIPPVA
jgi:carotenoid cleavage dioxygenase-like enzyme